MFFPYFTPLIHHAFSLNICECLVYHQQQQHHNLHQNQKHIHETQFISNHQQKNILKRFLDTINLY